MLPTPTVSTMWVQLLCPLSVLRTVSVPTMAVSTFTRLLAMWLTLFLVSLVLWKTPLLLTISVILMLRCWTLTILLVSWLTALGLTLQLKWFTRVLLESPSRTCPHPTDPGMVLFWWWAAGGLGGAVVALWCRKKELCGSSLLRCCG